MELGEIASDGSLFRHIGIGIGNEYVGNKYKHLGDKYVGSK